MSSILEYALTLFKSGHFSELDLYTQGKLSDDSIDGGDRLELLKLRGISLTQKGEFSGALECFDTALLLSPSDPIVQMNLVSCYFEVKEAEKACLLLESMLLKFPVRFISLMMENVENGIVRNDISFSDLGPITQDLFMRYVDDKTE